LIRREKDCFLLGGDKAGYNDVDAEPGNRTLQNTERKYWGVWAIAAENMSAYWQAETRQELSAFLQDLREQGQIGLANRGEDVVYTKNRREQGGDEERGGHSVKWWLQWLEWESLWVSPTIDHNVITWNIGPQGVDLSMQQIAHTLSKGAVVDILQEVSFHPGERRRIKRNLQSLGLDYWYVMEACVCHRVRDGREMLNVGISKKNWNAPWVYAVATFLHKDVYDRLDLTGKANTPTQT
jgi:hypothetical protein